MAKIKSVYICSECGYESPKWYGKCPSCGEWNTMNEELVDKKASTVQKSITKSSYSKPVTINTIDTNDEERYNTGSEELDRVLGGGIVKGSLVLLGGDPGIGKSTILLQICEKLGESLKILYVSGEESKRQLKLRAQRLGVNNGNIYIMTETDVEIVAEQIKIEIGSAFEPDEDKQVTVRGRDVVDGLPKQTTVTAPEIQKALEPGLMSIIAAAKEVLETTPPELSADIIDRGIMLTGGGALLKNIDKLISYYLQVPVLTADHPLEAVALGTGTLLKNIEKHQRH